VPMKVWGVFADSKKFMVQKSLPSRANVREHSYATARNYRIAGNFRGTQI
jgi:hypothetical protein